MEKNNGGNGVVTMVKKGLSSALVPLFITIFLHNFSAYIVIPAITDVTMAALCPGKDECSIAIYLTGFQQAVIGIGTLVMMPLLGKLSDSYGRRLVLIVPLILSIFPSAILAINRSQPFFIAYYALKILTSMFSDGAVHCIALAYVADIVPPIERAAIFAVLSGIGSCAFVCGTISARFLSTTLTFQVATGMAIVAALYTTIFLPEPVKKNLDLETKLIQDEQVETNKISSGNFKLLKALPSLLDMITLIKTSSVFSQAAIVAFLDSVGEVGFHAALMYYLKARFHFSKNQFADLMVIMGVAGTTSQLILMPLLVPLIGEERLLSIGLLFNCAHMFLYSVAWSSWVPYIAAMFAVLIVFIHPCLRSIVSKQVGPNDQGRAQGCISGISSSANVIAPLAFTPLTALFLSEDAPFTFPGFSIMCFGFVLMVALFQSLSIWVVPSRSNSKDEKYNLTAQV